MVHLRIENFFALEVNGKTSVCQSVIIHFSGLIRSSSGKKCLELATSVYSLYIWCENV